MLSTTWTTAPTAFAGLGAEVRPYVDCAAARPDLGGVAGWVRGSGAPSGSALRYRGTGLPTGMPISSALVPLSQRKFDQIPQNDGTTLGYHPSGRPLS